MFEPTNNRYATRNVIEEVPKATQLFIWSLIDKKNDSGIKLDYLQIFEFKVVNGVQKIIHRQEVSPFEYHITTAMDCKYFIDQEIWVIDSGEYQMMLLPKDY